LELEVGFMEDIEGLLADRFIVRTKVVCHPFPNSHKLYRRYKSHIILDGERMLQKEATLPYAFVIFEHSGTTGAVG
jgi:hypothetical protein